MELRLSLGSHFGREFIISKRQLTKALCIAALAAALSAFLIEVNGAVTSATMVALVVSVSSVSVLLVWTLIESNRKAHEFMALREGVINSLYKLLYYKSKDCSYLSSTAKVAKAAERGPLKALLTRASRACRLGGDFLESLQASGTFMRDSLLTVASANGTAWRPALRSAVANQALLEDEKQAEIDESLQRYAIVNMFLSTILPSFLVFALVGSSILSQSGPSTLLFSVTLLAILPMFYTTGNSLMWKKMTQ